MFRVEGKEHVYVNGRQHTSCNIFEQRGEGAFTHVEQAFVPGWHLSDDELIERWIDDQDGEQ